MFLLGFLIGAALMVAVSDLAEVYRVEYDGADRSFIEKELIDALYYACIDSRNNNTLI